MKVKNKTLNLEELSNTFFILKNKIDDNKDIINKKRTHFIYKEDGSPVSKSDIFLNKMITDFLNQNFAGIQIISEENDQRDVSEFIALVDPLDGTENFVSGLPIWGISIGIWKKNKNIFSWLYFPELNRFIDTYTVPKLTKHKSRITGFSSSINNTLKNEIKVGEESRIMGASSFNMHCVITGSFSRFRNPKGAWIWDLLPGATLCLENKKCVKINGKIYEGELLDPSKKHEFEII